MKRKSNLPDSPWPARFVVAAALLTGVFATAPGLADPTDTAEANAPWPIRLRAQMVRLASVEWRLRRESAPLCPRITAGYGIFVDHRDAYAPGSRADVARLLKLGEAPQILAVAAGSPAEQAGLHSGDEIVTIDGVPTAELLAQSNDPALFSEQIAAALAVHDRTRALQLSIQRGSTRFSTSIEAVALCDAPFILKTSGAVDAYSDGHRLVATSGLVDFAKTDDELALVTGHELAHVVNTDVKAAGLSDRRKMEDDADILGGAIARCAGYDINAAIAFWHRFRARDRLGFLRSPSHRSTSGRIARIAALQPVPCPLAADSTPGIRPRPAPDTTGKQ